MLRLYLVQDLCSLRVLLRIALELVYALLRAEIVILSVVVQFGWGGLLVNLHVANGISLHSILRGDWNDGGRQVLPALRR